MGNIMANFVLKGINGKKSVEVKKDTSTTIVYCHFRCHWLLCILFPDIRKMLKPPFFVIIQEAVVA